MCLPCVVLHMQQCMAITTVAIYNIPVAPSLPCSNIASISHTLLLSATQLLFWLFTFLSQNFFFFTLVHTQTAS